MGLLLLPPEEQQQQQQQQQQEELQEQRHHDENHPIISATSTTAYYGVTVELPAAAAVQVGAPSQPPPPAIAVALIGDSVDVYHLPPHQHQHHCMSVAEAEKEVLNFTRWCCCFSCGNRLSWKSTRAAAAAAAASHSHHERHSSVSSSSSSSILMENSSLFSASSSSSFARYKLKQFAKASKRLFKSCCSQIKATAVRCVPENNPKPWIAINSLCCAWSLWLLQKIVQTDTAVGRPYGTRLYMAWNFLTTVCWCIEVGLTVWYSCRCTCLRHAWESCRKQRKQRLRDTTIATATTAFQRLPGSSSHYPGALSVPLACCPKSSCAVTAATDASSPLATEPACAGLDNNNNNNNESHLHSHRHAIQDPNDDNDEDDEDAASSGVCGGDIDCWWIIERLELALAVYFLQGSWVLLDEWNDPQPDIHGELMDVIINSFAYLLELFLVVRRQCMVSYGNDPLNNIDNLDDSNHRGDDDDDNGEEWIILSGDEEIGKDLILHETIELPREPGIGGTRMDDALLSSTTTTTTTTTTNDQTEKDGSLLTPFFQRKIPILSRKRITFFDDDDDFAATDRDVTTANTTTTRGQEGPSGSSEGKGCYYDLESVLNSAARESPEAAAAASFSAAELKSNYPNANLT